MRLRRFRWVIVVAVILSALLAAAWYGLHFIPADLGYEVVTEFTELPPDDRELEEWVKSQPGIWGCSVTREPSGERTRLEVFVGMIRNGWGQPPFPDLESKCAELGYRGQVAPFRDRRQR